MEWGLLSLKNIMNCLFMEDQGVCLRLCVLERSEGPAITITTEREKEIYTTVSGQPASCS